MVHSNSVSAWAPGLLAALLSAACSGPPDTSSIPPEVVRPLVEELEGSAPGFSVAVARDGNLVWSAGYGFADLEGGTRATGETRYPTYSIAKTWTAVALAKLAQDGRLDPEGRVGELMDLKNESLGDATILQLATHTSGVRHYADEDEARGAHCETVSQALAIFSDDPLAGPPGERNYSTWGYVLLSGVIEAVTGVPYPAFMHRTVFDHYGARGVVAAAESTPIPMYERSSDQRWVRARADPSCKFGGGGFLAPAEAVAIVQSAGLADPDIVPRFKAMIYEIDDQGFSVAQGRSYGGASAVATDVEAGWTVAVAMNANPEGVDLEALVRDAVRRVAASDGFRVTS